MTGNVRPTPLLLPDIDGTIRQGKEDELGKFVNTASDVRVFPEAVARMREIKEGGGRILGISNQGGIALGYTTEAVVRATMHETNEQAEQLFDEILWCPHHPSVSPCWCRKPGTSLVVHGIESLMDYNGETYAPGCTLFVGDRDEDLECARRLDVHFKWAKHWRNGG